MENYLSGETLRGKCPTVGLFTSPVSVRVFPVRVVEFIFTDARLDAGEFNTKQNVVDWRWRPVRRASTTSCAHSQLFDRCFLRNANANICRTDAAQDKYLITTLAVGW